MTTGIYAAIGTAIVAVLLWIGHAFGSRGKKKEVADAVEQTAAKVETQTRAQVNRESTAAAQVAQAQAERNAVVAHSEAQKLPDAALDDRLRAQGALRDD